MKSADEIPANTAPKKANTPVTIKHRLTNTEERASGTVGAKLSASSCSTSYMDTSQSTATAARKATTNRGPYGISFNKSEYRQT